jgi:Flp pilus assembly protein TadD
MWELTVVTIVGVVLLGPLTGPATAGWERRPAHTAGRPVERLRPVLVAGALVAGLVVIAAQAIVLLTHLQIERSQAAAARGDQATALEAAQAARDLEPWAASPRIQLALVLEDAGRLDGAAVEMRAAGERDPENWRPHYLRGRILAGLGEARAAEQSIELARSLNPRSPIWRQAGS